MIGLAAGWVTAADISGPEPDPAQQRKNLGQLDHRRAGQIIGVNLRDIGDDLLGLKGGVQDIIAGRSIHQSRIPL
jgi:hypothetical protein